MLKHVRQFIKILCISFYKYSLYINSYIECRMKKSESVSHSVMSNSLNPWTVAHQAPLSMEFSWQEYWSGNHSLLQGIFPTQGSNLSLLHCMQILYHLSHQGSPEYRIHLYKYWILYEFNNSQDTFIKKNITIIMFLSLNKNHMGKKNKYKL